MSLPGVCVWRYTWCPLLVERSTPDSSPREWEIALVVLFVPPSSVPVSEQQELPWVPFAVVPLRPSSRWTEGGPSRSSCPGPR